MEKSNDEIKKMWKRGVSEHRRSDKRDPTFGLGTVNVISEEQVTEIKALQMGTREIYKRLLISASGLHCQYNCF